MQIDKQAFDSYGDEALTWACIGPMLIQVRAKSMEVKGQLYKQLTEGQRALMMFHVFYGHAKHSASELYAWTAHLLSEGESWEHVLSSLRYFGDDQLLELVERVRVVVEGRTHPPTLNDLAEDDGLSSMMNLYYEAFQQLLPHTMARIASFIRTDTDQFVRLKTIG